VFADLDLSVLQRFRTWVHEQAPTAPLHDPILEALRTLGERVLVAPVFWGLLIAIISLITCETHRHADQPSVSRINTPPAATPWWPTYPTW